MINLDDIDIIEGSDGKWWVFDSEANMLTPDEADTYALNIIRTAQKAREKNDKTD